ncbi:MAG: PP2C family protein-serine/threonine phosphatase [Isosphaeraceae bacterium]
MAESAASDVASEREGFVLFGSNWEERLARVVAMLRGMSRETDPQAMVRNYGAQLRQLMPVDRFVSLSRRGLDEPHYRITRSSTWNNAINPWRELDRLPLREGGLLAELLYSSEPRIIDDLDGVLADDDPAREFLDGMRSLMAIPHYEDGEVVNAVILMKADPGAFRREEFPEMVWLSGLFGRATHNLVLTEQLREAYEVVERELKVVADLQRSLLPRVLPEIPGLTLAASYQTSRWAGGDYYDVFALPDNRWGLMIADVSGHGTPAAVMMAVTHSIAHTYPGNPEEPSALLAYLNHHLTSRYTADVEAFVTAFYGIYDPAKRTLTYASAGHNPPRLKRCKDGAVIALDAVGSVPLGLFDDVVYDQETLQLQPGDKIVFYTDGITEATDPSGREQFGTGRLDESLAHCHLDADGLIQTMLAAVKEFTGGTAPADDQTLLVAKVY